MQQPSVYSSFEKARIKFRDEFSKGIKPVDSRQPIPDELAKTMVQELIDLEVPKDALIGIFDAFLILSTHLKEAEYTNLVLLENNHKNYKGPMTPWVRVFSNSTGKSLNGMVPKSFYLNKKSLEKDYDGFILKAGDGFFDAFGYQQNKPLSDTYAVIGYEANGDAHYIDNKYRSQMRYLAPENKNKDFPQNSQVSSILPPPGIVSVTVKQSKEFLTYSTVNFKCFGLAQLEYLTPFFFTAGINVFVEFGWNLFNQKSLINLSKMDECWEIVAKPQTALNRADMSYGNYGCVSGIITKYSFSTKDGFAYDCSFESISRQGLYSGMRIDSNPTIQNTTITINTSKISSK